MPSFNIQKRLIGSEDINWDAAGEGERDDFVNSAGQTKTLHKINASHIPLKSDSRIALGQTDVDSALKSLDQKLDSLSESTEIRLTEDTFIYFSADDSVSDIQEKINRAPHNLNRHILHFVFPASLIQALTVPLYFSSFSNGTLEITGTDVTIMDSLSLDSLFVITGCSCEVNIRGLSFQHTNSLYGVSVIRSNGVYFANCRFTGSSGSTTYGVFFEFSDGIFDNCSFENDIEFAGNSVNWNPPKAPELQAGAIVWFPTKTAPDGFLVCDGSAVGRGTYLELFNAIGTRFGAGDGLTTFNLPNLLDKTVWGGSADAVGTELEAGLPNITGSTAGSTRGFAGSGKAASAIYGTGTLTKDWDGEGAGSLYSAIGFDASRSNAIYGKSETVQPPALTLLPCIKAYGVSDNPGGVPGMVTSVCNVEPDEGGSVPLTGANIPASSTDTTAVSTYAKAAVDLAESANAEAERAKSTATDAKQTAEAAAADVAAVAGPALEKADQALSAAQTAQETADSVLSTAQSAQSEAANAITLAQQAQSEAQSASSAASTADSNAGQAYQKADEADAKADSVISDVYALTNRVTNLENSPGGGISSVNGQSPDSAGNVTVGSDNILMDNGGTWHNNGQSLESTIQSLETAISDASSGVVRSVCGVGTSDSAGDVDLTAENIPVSAQGWGGNVELALSNIAGHAEAAYQLAGNAQSTADSVTSAVGALYQNNAHEAYAKAVEAYNLAESAQSTAAVGYPDWSNSYSLILSQPDTDYTMPSDGWLLLRAYTASSGITEGSPYGYNVSINGIQIWSPNFVFISTTSTTDSLMIPVKSGDVVSWDGNFETSRCSMTFYYNKTN